MSENSVPFWKNKKLHEMSTQEWESLCDNCGKCCLEKFYVENTNELFTTNVACRLLDLDTAKCSNYKNRFKYIDDCLKLTIKMVETISWLPKTCSYRLIHEGKDLPDWHPLVTNNPNSTLEQNKSIKGKAIHPYFANNNYEEYPEDI